MRLSGYTSTRSISSSASSVVSGLFCLVGVQVNLAHEIAFIQGALAVLQCLDLLLIFGAFRHGAICPKRTVRGKRRGGFHLLFQRQECRLLQLCGIDSHFVTAAFYVRLGMAAIVMAGPIAKEVAEEYGISPKMLVAISTCATLGYAISAFDIIPLLF